MRLCPGGERNGIISCGARPLRQGGVIDGWGQDGLERTKAERILAEAKQQLGDRFELRMAMLDLSIGLDGSGKHFDQCALSGPVLADERMHLAGRQIEGHVLQRAYATIAFLDPAGFEQQHAIIQSLVSTAG